MAKVTRSIKVRQRACVEYNVIGSADGTSLSGLDSLQLSMADTGTGDKLITLPEALQDICVQLSVGTADCIAQVGTITSTSVQVLSFDATDGTTAKDAIVHIRIVGSKTADRY